MTLLIIGAGGLVGSALVRRAARENIDVVSLRRAELDITDPEAVHRSIQTVRPAVVINAAAYTAVDRAESEPERALAVNAGAVESLARACREAETPLIHYSTDCVFDGEKADPYVETDPVNPRSAYGRSKAEGERRLREILPEHVILRVSWVFGVTGSNFVRTVLGLARERSELRIVDDQHGGPTPADSIAGATLRVVEAIVRGQPTWGTFHIAGTPATTWHGFAEAIVRVAADQGAAVTSAVTPISTAEHGAAACRPRSSRFDCAKIGEAYDIRPCPWAPALERTIEEILRD